LSRIKKAFKELERQHDGALIAYVTCGDPDPSYTPKIAGALAKGGVDILELGIPFSDPIADGPTIQAAASRALKSGTTPKMSMEIAREIKEEHDIPIAVLTYYNPIYRTGLEEFFKLTQNCKVDGLIVADLPVEEASNYKKTARTYGVDTIFLAAPSTANERLMKIVENTSGFLYLISVFGVTGVRERVQALTVQTTRRISSQINKRIPLAVGFGISKPEHVKRVIESGADGAIVGSAFINIIATRHQNIDVMLRELEENARKLKEATPKP